eukprot:TRINITY_DN34568_c0_g1_i1.p1 TRINITY_DN34568_c0_g1~~TRINITY_DN34568_c0_g1_i1.p1  ORF type:complete len:154 (+),score=16.59 TRINITY_DN34568_c0_g1_i1:81-542(+)
MASPPKETELPIPSFDKKVQQSLAPTGDCMSWSTARGTLRVAATLGRLAACCPERLCDLLADVANLLLSACSSKTASLPFLGARISQSSKELLRSMRQRLFDVLRCYPNYFYLYEHDRTIYIAYMHHAWGAHWTRFWDLAAICEVPGTTQLRL